MASRYVSASEAGDIDAIVSMLTADAIRAMPPWASWFAGRETLRTLYAQYPVWGGRPRRGVFRIHPTELNGELAFAEYCRDQPDGPYRALAFTIALLDRSGVAIAEKVSFVDAGLLVRAGLPATLAG